MYNRDNPIEEASVINVISTVTKVGDGSEDNPSRLLRQYWDFSGNLLAQKDGDESVR